MDKHGIKYTLIAALLVLACLQPSAAAEKWTLKDEDDGIATYSRAREGSDYHEYKATGIIEASMAEIGDVLRDVPHYPGWMAKVKHAEILKKYTPNDMDVYLVLNFPWPSSDRDVVATAETVAVSEVLGTITTTQVKEKSDVEEKDGLVRVPAMYQQYIMSYKEMEKTEFTYSIFLEAGGTLPALTVNPALEGVPYTSIKNLREFVEKERYQEADPFDAVNLGVTEVLVEGILKKYFVDNEIIDMVLRDRELMKTTLENGYAEDGFFETTAAVLKQYVRTPAFAEDIRVSDDRALLSRMASSPELAEELVEEEDMLELLLAEGAVTDAVMEKMALILEDELD